MAKHPYVTRRGKVYYYRRKVPSDLRKEYAPKAEITFSLKTSDVREAHRKANIESVRLDEEFESLRRRVSAVPTAELSADQIRALADEHYQRLLEEDEEVRFEGTGDAEVFGTVAHQLESVPGAQPLWRDDQVIADYGLSEREHIKLIERQKHLGPYYRSALSRGDISVVFDEVDELLEEHGLRLDRDTESYRRLAREVLKANVKADEAFDQRLHGKVVETPAPSKQQPAATIVHAAPAPATTQPGSISCSQLWDQYASERQLPTKTISDFGAYMHRFIELHGDLPVTTVARTHARSFRDAMLKYPARPSGALKSLPVPEVLERLKDKSGVQRLSPRTVNQKAIGALRSVFAFAVENDYLPDNPFRGIKAAETKSYEPQRIPYTLVDLTLIFSTPVFSTGDRPSSAGGEAAKWLPLLALFTGARLEELGRLTVQDVLVEDGVDFIFIRAGDGGRSLKTKSSRRKVPIHSDLIRLGFLEYVEQKRREGHASLWPQLRSTQAQVTAGFSKWWGRYIRQHGLTDKRKVFHSFRHLVKRQLRNAGVDKGLIDAVQGHAAKDVADRVYGLDEEGLGVSLPVLKEAIEKLQYPGLNLEHLSPTRPDS